MYILILIKNQKENLIGSLINLKISNLSKLQSNMKISAGLCFNFSNLKNYKNQQLMMILELIWEMIFKKGSF